MKCPFCHNNCTSVIDSRESDDGDVIRRRRRCLSCNRRFTTYEKLENISPIVIKRDGNITNYDRQKLWNSIALAVRKRPFISKDIDNIVILVEEKIFNNGLKEIQTKTIGEYVMIELEKLDKIAYVRFASVYRNFKDVGEFIETIQKIC